MPELPGVILYMSGHVGIYTGNGRFLEISGSPCGMVEGKIVNGQITKGSKFTHWFKDAYIDYTPVIDLRPEDPSLKEEGPAIVGNRGMGLRST